MVKRKLSSGRPVGLTRGCGGKRASQVVECWDGGVTVRRREERERVIDQDELAELVANLVDERNKITYDKLLSLFPKIEDHPERLERLVVDLANLDIAVVDGHEADESE